MKKILMVVSTLNNGGAQKIMSNIMMSLPSDWTVDIILNDVEKIAYPYKGNIISLGLKSQLDKTKVWYQLKVFLKRMQVVHKYKKSGEYVACLSALTSANAVNVLTGKKYCRCVLSEHNYMSDDVGNGLKKCLMTAAIRLLYNKADKVVAVSEGIAHNLIHQFKVKQDKVKTIYNGYVIDDIVRMSKEVLKDNEAAFFEDASYTIITVGRLSRQKGQWHLIRALTKVKEKIPNIRLLILGEGELKNELQEMIEKCGLENHVFLCGFVDNPYKFMRNSAAFVLPSLYEGFGNVIVESFCCEVPCISTDFNVGAREIMAPDTNIMYRVQDSIEHVKYGILCPVCKGEEINKSISLTREEHLLADTLIELLKDEQLRLQYAQRGMERAKDFDMKKIILQWMSVCEE